ncbi:MAG: HAD-IIIA family hydrolase [Candidatus Niyogibacteria bacterium]|nr:MAG: HAD-IIIA family hydrolase [Candidatus Niyogibacteria bacterium]
MKGRKAVFIDRDGVVNKLVQRPGFDLPTAPFAFEELRIFNGVKEALLVLKRIGVLRILVTNQPDVVYGYLSYEEWKKIQDEIEKLGFDDVFICPHGRDDGCECKKPKPGMLLAAQKKWNIDLGRSFMIGDTQTDMMAAKTAGCRTILVKDRYNSGVMSDFRAGSLLEAARLIARLITEGGAT